MIPDWLEVKRGESPLIISIPHTGLDLCGLEPKLVSPWLARKDADWHVERLYDFVGGLDATILHTRVSRTVIDVNRDPSGASLYPGQATTSLCPTVSFDGEMLYLDGSGPDEAEIAERKRRLVRALSSGARCGSRAPQRTARRRAGLRLPFDPFAHPKIV